MALARVEDLEGGLKEPEQCLDPPLGSPNNPVIRLRALRVEGLVSPSVVSICLFFLGWSSG